MRGGVGAKKSGPCCLYDPQDYVLCDHGNLSSSPQLVDLSTELGPSPHPTAIPISQAPTACQRISKCNSHNSPVHSKLISTRSAQGKKETQGADAQLNLRWETNSYFTTAFLSDHLIILHLAFKGQHFLNTSQLLHPEKQ